MRILRRVLVILLVIALVLALAYAGFVFLYRNWHYIMDLRAIAKPADGVHIEQLDDGVRVSDYDSDSYVVFNRNRECVEAHGITPIVFNQRNMRGYDGLDDFEAVYGQAHLQWGSGVHWPVYITSDGYLLVMWNPYDDHWSEVWMEDLLATPM